MTDDETAPRETPGAQSAPEPAGAVFTPLVNRRYLRELARYRMLLSGGEQVPGERAAVLVRWWETLDEVVAAHHRAMVEVVWALLRERDPEAGTVVATMNTRYELLGAARAEAGAALTGFLLGDAPPSSARLAFIRYHEEMSATAFWEEREIISRARRLFTAADWQRVESYVLAVQAAGDRLEQVLPWLCEGLSSDRAARVLEALPPFLRETYLVVWLPAHRQFTSRAWPRRPAPGSPA
ncbi:hypothetical protein [Streptomyces sp. NPDC047097]|uniref:hypothetical protein n=1 Tax=Streptomyces sp. NPDC047097 TaxID=3155260 RepID=UPI00340BA831